jgi:hypothetical protein
MYLMSAWSLKWPLRVSRKNTPMSWGPGGAGRWNRCT